MTESAHDHSKPAPSEGESTRRKGGPKTPTGRALVRYNALKHGIHSESPVLPVVESEEHWRRHRTAILQSIDPQSGLEEALAERIAAILWRLKRIVRYERESIANSQSYVGKDIAIAAAYSGKKLPSHPTPEFVEQVDRMLMDRLLPDDSTLNKIMRYETRLHRHLLQTLHQLYSLRAAPAPPRIRTDIEHTDIRRIAVRSPRQTPPAPHH